MSQTGYAYIKCAVITNCDGRKNCLSYITDILQEPALQKCTAANIKLIYQRTFDFKKMVPYADTIKKSLFIDTKETRILEMLVFCLTLTDSMFLICKHNYAKKSAKYLCVLYLILLIVKLLLVM